MSGKVKLIVVSILAAVIIYLISLVEDKYMQLLLGFVLMATCLVIVLYQRKRE